MKKLTVQLDKDGDRDVLAQIAASFGLYAKRGAGAGTLGSVGRLLRGIVRGEYKVMAVIDKKKADE